MVLMKILFKYKSSIPFQKFVRFLKYYATIFRQGRVEDFQQTLLKEYVDFTTQAPKAPFDGINIKIKQKQEPKNIFGMCCSINFLKINYYF